MSDSHLDVQTYIIDGDNLIGWRGGPRDGDDRRAEIVREVADVCRRLHATATVVFDRGAQALPEVPIVAVRVADGGRSADDVIRAMVDGAADRSVLTIVTSDKPLFSYARTRGARILRCHEWRRL
jgi:hypothetical protein